MFYRRLLIFLRVLQIVCNGGQNPRIIGGRNALPGQFPFVVSLQYKRTHFCAASIISKFHVLTAAHCVQTIYDVLTNYNGSMYDFTLAAGTVTLDSNGDVYYIQKIPSNTDWFNKTGRAEDDFAVLQVRSQFVLTNHVKLAQIYGGFIGSGVDVYILGWGYTTDKFKLSNSLKYARVKTIGNNDCDKYYGGKINAGHLCTLSSNSRRTCGGDSGGPLVTINGAKLIGIQSQGGVNCGVITPDIYARISPEKISSLVLNLHP